MLINTKNKQCKKIKNIKNKINKTTKNEISILNKLQPRIKLPIGIENCDDNDQGIP